MNKTTITKLTFNDDSLCFELLTDSITVSIKGSDKQELQTEDVHELIEELMDWMKR